MGFAFENFDLPIVGSIVVNLSVTYHNLSVENRNPMEKESAQSDLPSKRKVPNTIRKYHFRGNGEIKIFKPHENFN